MAGDINWVLHELKQRDEENPRLSSQLGVRSRPELHGAPFCTETQQKQYLDDIKSLFFKTQSLKRLSILKSKALSLPSSTVTAVTWDGAATPGKAISPTHHPADLCP